MDDLEKRRGLLKRVFLQTDEGKRVLDYLLNHCMIFKSTYSSDPMEMAFRDGARSVGLHILHMVEFDDSQKVTENKLIKGLGAWKK
jgi:hypothetical protein